MISTKFGKNHPWVKGIQVCLNKEPYSARSPYFSMVIGLTHSLIVDFKQSNILVLVCVCVWGGGVPNGDMLPFGIYLCNVDR